MLRVHQLDRDPEQRHAASEFQIWLHQGRDDAGEQDEQHRGTTGAQDHSPEPSARRTASAITTALSPDNRILMPMICNAASQNAGCMMSVSKAPLHRLRWPLGAINR